MFQLSDDVLQGLAEPHVRPLIVLRVFVGTDTRLLEHNDRRTQKFKISDESWQKLCCHSPDLKVTVTFHDLIDYQDECLEVREPYVLQPSIPLYTLNFLFISPFFKNEPTLLSFVRQHYATTLRRLCIMRGIDSKPNQYRDDDQEDELVLLAWQCKNLESFTLIGK